MTNKSGYRLDLFSKQLEEKFLCEACHFVLNRAIQSRCGHRYCEECFKSFFRKFPEVDTVKCKACEDEGIENEELRQKDMFPDRAISRELNALPVKCINDGCNWTGKLRDYENDHQHTCDFEMIPCVHKDGCGASIRRGNFSEHLQNHCPMRIVLCEPCQTEYPKKLLRNHQKECLEYPIECQFCRQITLPRRELKRHQSPETGDCSRKLVTCKYKLVGCDALFEEENTHEHSRENIHRHQGLLGDRVLEIRAAVEDAKENRIALETLDKQSKSQANQIKELEGHFNVLREEVAEVNHDHRGYTDSRTVTQFQSNMQSVNAKSEQLKNKCTVLETKVATYEGIVAVLNGQIERDAQVLQTLERQRRQDRELLESLERKIKAQDRIIALKDVALAEQDLRIQSLEMASYDGILVWKISDFTRKLNEARSGRTTSFYSPCFYTGQSGYKMCARIYLHGDGMGKGNHVSLFFTIMRGPHDALMRWPFRQKVTLMWLDQNNREHVIDAFRPDPTSSSFQRPKNDMNVASGCPLFMPISQIDSPRHAYVKNDVAFIKIIVDVSDIG